MKTTLTHRQERFVYEYLLDQNASAAAQRAGYSSRTKGTQAAEIMKNPLVKARIVRELADLRIIGGQRTFYFALNANPEEFTLTPVPSKRRSQR